MSPVQKFWKWYEGNYTFNAGIAAGLFVIQIIHLIWLFGEVLWFKLTGAHLFEFHGLWKPIIILVDYTEIPAIISTTIVYVHEIRTRGGIKPWMYVLFINSQWLHLFWITDEFVINAFTEHTALLPLWLAWIALLIDYLELPVILDTIQKFTKSMRDNRAKEFLQNGLREV